MIWPCRQQAYIGNLYEKNYPFQNHTRWLQYGLDQLGDLHSEIATQWGIEFFDAGDVIATSPVDGVRFEKDAHQALSMALVKKITTIM